MRILLRSPLSWLAHPDAARAPGRAGGRFVSDAPRLGVILALLLAAAYPLPAADPPRASETPPVAPCAALGSLVTAAGTEVRAAGVVVYTAQAPVTALACSGGRIAVGARDGRRGAVQLLDVRDAGGGERPPVLELPRPALALALAGERVAALVPGTSSRSTLYFHGPGLPPRGVERPLPAEPAALTLSAEDDALLVAIGKDVRTFRMSDGTTWLIWNFPQPVSALATRAGVGRLLVGQERRVVAVDPGDVAVRGVLPVRSAAELPGTVRAVAWLGDGRIAAAAVDEEAAVLLLDGETLEEVGRIPTAVPPLTLVPLEGPRLAWSAGEAAGEAEVAAAVWAAASPPVARPSPPETPALAPASAAVVAAAAPPSTPAPVSAPASAPPPAPSPAQPPAPPEAQPLVSAPAQPPAATPAPPPAPAGAAPPAAVSAAAAAASAPVPAAGEIAGALSGEIGLVSEIVIAGPDSLLTVAAVVKPADGRYKASGLKPGRYRVTPMGPGGASLRTTPPFASVKVGANEGARADFAISGRW